MSEIVSAAIERYLDALRPTGDPLQAEMEARAAREGFPIVGAQVGALLALLARLIGARRVFELGSGFGYSTLFFARAVGAGGEVVHTDGSAALSADARSYLTRAGVAARVRFAIGSALELFAAEPGPFDLVFCDVDKEEYPRVPELALPRLRPGGLLVFDNALWHGRVTADPPADAATAAVQALNRQLADHAGFETVILPLRDGVSISRRR